LARGNLQRLEVLDLLSKPKLSQSNFLVYLKEQSTRCDKYRPDQIFTKFLGVKTVENEP
jgi:hypothetical protein